MESANWQQLKNIFHEALEIDSDKRAAFLISLHIYVSKNPVIYLRAGFSLSGSRRLKEIFRKEKIDLPGVRAYSRFNCPIRGFYVINRT